MAPAIQIRRLTNPTPSELDSAAEVLAAAWHGDHFAEALIRGQYEFMVPWRRATITAAAIGGELHVASYGDIGIVGVSAWFGPGQALFDSPEQRAAGFDNLMQSFPADHTKWWREYFLPRYGAHTTAILGEGTKLASWHLQVLGTHPDFQRKGIGRALITFMESTVFPQGHMVILETHTEKNVATYTKWGYSATPPEHYDSETGGFDLYVMFKTPKVEHK